MLAVLLRVPSVATLLLYSTATPSRAGSGDGAMPESASALEAARQPCCAYPQKM